MIVAAQPRSGGSVYAHDLAKRHNALFVNELVPLFIKPVNCWKNDQHELKGQQPTFTTSQLFDYIKRAEDDDIVILANGSNTHWVYDKAKYFVARRNQRQWIQSYANLLLRLGCAYEEALQFIKMHTYQSICLFAYCKEFNKTIDFYEDSVYYRESSYQHLTNYPRFREMMYALDEMLDDSQIYTTYPGLCI